VCVFGNAGVGKTTLVKTFLTGVFSREYKMTIGADFYIKKVMIEDKEIVLQIWDFGGENKFRFLLPTYAAGSSGGICMYDITNASSILNIENWLNVFKQSSEGDLLDIPIILVGGKIDLESKRTISKNDALKLMKNYNFVDFIECSAKTGVNIEQIFYNLSLKMLDNVNI
jgi:small GTP-binding protein